MPHLSSHIQQIPCQWRARDISAGGRSIFSILMLIMSCAGYTYFDQGFKLQAYTWLCVWYCFFLFEACYVKHICDTVHMTSKLDYK